MNFSPEQLLAFKAEYAVRRRRHNFAIIGSFIFCIIGSVMLMKYGSDPRVVIGIALGLISFDTFWNWRCPACRAYLGGGGAGSLGGASSLNFCRNCGVPLQYTDPPNVVQ